MVSRRSVSICRSRGQSFVLVTPMSFLPLAFEASSAFILHLHLELLLFDLQSLHFDLLSLKLKLLRFPHDV